MGVFMKGEFNARDVLIKIRKARAIRRKRNTWGKSSLTKYLPELLKLQDADASLADLQYWLRTTKRKKRSCTAIKRVIDQFKSISSTTGE